MEKFRVNLPDNKYVDFTLRCAICKKCFPVDKMEEHVKDCKDEHPEVL